MNLSITYMLETGNFLAILYFAKPRINLLSAHYNQLSPPLVTPQTAIRDPVTSDSRLLLCSMKSY